MSGLAFVALLVILALVVVVLAGLWLPRRRSQSRHVVDSRFIAGLTMIASATGFLALLLAPSTGLSRGTTFIVVGGALIGVSLAVSLIRIAYLLGTQNGSSGRKTDL